MVTNLSIVDYAILDSSNPDTNDHTSTSIRYSTPRTYSTTIYKEVLIHYSLEQQYRRKCFGFGKPSFYVNYIKEYYESTKLPEEVSLQVIGLKSNWDANTATYNSRPNIDSRVHCELGYSTDLSGMLHGDFSSNSVINLILDNGICVFREIYNSSGEIDVSVSSCTSNINTLRVYFDLENYDNGYDITGCSPSSGFIPKYSANTFTWGTQLKGESIDNVSVSNIKFRWRYTGASGYTEINCGTNNSCTIPANTFTQNSVDWCVVLTDSWGATSSSSWMTVSTQEVTSTCECVSPKNTTVETGNVLTFSWNHIISTGTLPTRTDLQYSTDGASWSTLATVSGSSTHTNIPARTFSSGQYYWRARTYNTDSAVGSWSDSVSFIAIGSPTLSGLRCTTSPKAVVSWQSSDQLGYQVQIDGFDSGVIYGTEYRYQYNDYLYDGQHTVRVRVVNQYGFWSDWSSISVTTVHTEGSSIRLTGYQTDAVSKIQWSTDGLYTGFIVYRDGIEIASTIETTYTDEMAVGSVEYKVRGIYSNSDNYGLSNALPLNLVCNVTKISRLGSDQWLPIPNSDSQTRDIGFVLSSETTAKHYLNSVYPIAELSKQKNRYMNIRVAFTEMDEANAFAALLNSVVVCKTNKQTMITGIITSISMTENEFFYGFNCRIQQTGEV